MRDKTSLLAAASLIGTIIGAGVFGIPYIMAKSGVLFCLFYFLILGIIVLFLHSAFGEIVLRTNEKHRLIGYAEKYLGKKAKILITFSTIFGTIGALLAYIILGGDFLKIIFPAPFSTFQLSLLLWIILSFFVLLGIKSIAWTEVFLNIGFLVVIFLIFFFSFPKINPANFVLANKNYIFLPYGIILFSLVGWNAVPEIERILSKKGNLKKVIISSMVFVVGFYFLFGLIISGVTGQNTTEEAFQGLLPILGRKIMILGGLFGLFCVSTSFLILGNYLKNALIFDYHFPRFLAFFLACFSPLALFLTGIREFIWVIAFVGTFMGLIEGTVICLVYKNAKKLGERVPEYSLKIPKILLYLIPLIFIFGAISQIIYYFQ
ncbi:amino acid permease [bacterium]|nr:amino acid permease [bacterium]